MNMDKAHSRPSQVTTAVIMLALSFIGDIAKLAAFADMKQLKSYVFIGGGAALRFALLWFVFRGMNWARWLFVALFLLGLIRIQELSKVFLGEWTFDTVFFVLQLLVRVCAVVLLLSQPASEWFREKPRTA